MSAHSHHTTTFNMRPPPMQNYLILTTVLLCTHHILRDDACLWTFSERPPAVCDQFSITIDLVVYNGFHGICLKKGVYCVSVYVCAYIHVNAYRFPKRYPYLSVQMIFLSNSIWCFFSIVSEFICVDGVISATVFFIYVGTSVGIHKIVGILCIQEYQSKSNRSHFMCEEMFVVIDRPVPK